MNREVLLCAITAYLAIGTTLMWMAGEDLSAETGIKMFGAQIACVLLWMPMLIWCIVEDHLLGRKA